MGRQGAAAQDADDGGVGIFLAIAGAFYLMGGRYVGSDDSYVHANKLMVSTDVSGLVQDRQCP